jgi:hypothetical protein
MLASSRFQGRQEVARNLPAAGKIETPNQNVVKEGSPAMMLLSAAHRRNNYTAV